MSNSKNNDEMAVQKIELSELDQGASTGSPVLNGNYDVIKNVKVKLQVFVGEAELSVAELFALKHDSVIQLDRVVSSPVDVLLDGKCVARGELVAADDNFGLRVMEINN